MKCTIITTLLAASTFSAYAGPEMIAPASAPYTPPAASGTSFFDDMKDWAVRPTLTSRLRLETRTAQGSDTANAGTISLSPGLATKSFGGFSGVVEAEFTYAFYDEYNSGPQPQLYPKESTTPILDPQTEEINQAYLQYKGAGFTVKAGRQRIILDKAAHVGNVGWRQNEQTYDGITLGYKKDGYNATLGYINQVNRIFGNEAIGAVKELQGHGIIANVSGKMGATTVGGYAYLLDFYETAGFTGANGNTFGLHAAAKGLYAEAAFQEDTGNNPKDDQSFYGHVKYSKKAAGGMGTIGLEYLGADFNTPLATVHAYNGFADVFIGERLGLSTNGDGIANFYASYVKKGLPGGFVFKGFLHYFMDEGFGDSYGWEADAVLAKKLSKQATLVSKFAYFFADNDTAYVNDVAQASVQLDFKF